MINKFNNDLNIRAKKKPDPSKTKIKSEISDCLEHNSDQYKILARVWLIDAVALQPNKSLVYATESIEHLYAMFEHVKNALIDLKTLNLEFYLSIKLDLNNETKTIIISKIIPDLNGELLDSSEISTSKLKYIKKTTLNKIKNSSKILASLQHTRDIIIFDLIAEGMSLTQIRALLGNSVICPREKAILEYLEYQEKIKNFKINIDKNIDKIVK